jgi:hypothetical protein
MLAKKQKPELEHGARRRLEDFPEWAEALETQRRLATELAQIVANYQHVDIMIHQQTPQESRISQLRSLLLDKVGARPAKPVQPSEEEGPALAEKRAACEQAIAQQERKVNDLRLSLATEIYRDWEDEHFAARQRIARAIIEAAEAIRDEQTLAEKMAAAGAISSPCFGSRLWVNCSNSPTIPSVFRPMNIRAFIECNRNLLD